jgi:hypothetical protein
MIMIPTGFYDARRVFELFWQAIMLDLLTSVNLHNCFNNALGSETSTRGFFRMF